MIAKILVGLMVFVVVPLAAARWLGRSNEPVDYRDPWGSEDTL